MADKIIILSGKQFSGKDTVAKILLDALPSFKRIGLADSIKLKYGNENDLTIEEIEKNKHLYRSDLIALGDKGRAIDPDYWLKTVISQEGDIIVPDVRVKRELELFKEHNAFAVRVEASKDTRALRGQLVKENDMTETALDDVKDWDYVIHNDFDYNTLLLDSKPLINAIRSYFSI